MKTVRNILFVLAFISCTSAFAQFDEVGLEGGIANYFGDLNMGMSMKNFKPAVGVFYRKNISTHFAWKSNLNGGQLQFDSKLNSNAYWQYQNLNFRATMGEATTVIEFNFFKYKSNKIKDCRWSPFVFCGLGMMYYDLHAKYDDKWVALPPLATEGKTYNTLLFVLPFGGGLKFNIAKFITLEIEEVYHHTYSDQLDDVSSTYTKKAVYANKGATNIADPSSTTNPLSHVVGKQRGEQYKDKYLFTFVSLSYTFHTPHCPNPDVNDGFEIFDR